MIFTNRLQSSTQMSFSKRILPLASVLVVASMAIDLTPSLVQASPSKAVSVSNQPARGQVPGRRRGGARRGDCPATSTELTALVPATEVSRQALPATYVGGSTMADHPTFWFYVPFSLNPDLTAEFVLQDETGQDIYRAISTDFSASERTPGIINVSLPSTIAPLQIGKVYQWYFKLNCGLEAPMYVQGGIERIPLDPGLAKQLASASRQQQFDLYLTNNAWFDAVTILAQLYRAQPTDTTVKSTWTKLLRSIGLEEQSILAFPS